jgi:hypothetical protein
MTPLAQAILVDSTLPQRRQQFQPSGDVTPADIARIQRELHSAHAFELTAVQSAMTLLTQKLAPEAVNNNNVLPVDETRMFLPAPITWLEWRTQFCDYEELAVHKLSVEAAVAAARMAPTCPGRIGLLICQGSADHATVDVVVCDDDDAPLLLGGFPLALRGSPDVGNLLTIAEAVYQWSVQNSVTAGQAAIRCHAALAIINTPKIIGRRDHAPHVGLQRRLAAAQQMVGKFPLHAWTEIVLDITPPALADGAPYETHLTGERALHFCRAYLRVRCGRLETVSSHWRGNPALGIKQARYVVKQGRANSAHVH